MTQISKKVEVSEKIIGRKLARDVYITDANYVFVSQGTIVTFYVYRRLIEENIREVFVCEKVEESTLSKIKVEPKFEKFKEGYIERTNKLTNLFGEVVSNNKLNIEETSNMCLEIIKTTTDKHDAFMFLENLRSVDDYLYSHSVNVATMAGLFGKWLGFSEYDLENLTMCGLLHDIGKTRVDLNILNKAQKLTDFEFSEIKLHTVRGYELLKHHDISNEVKEVAYTHHEKLDGFGYPRGLKLNQISKYSRIISIVDIFDAMSHARVYRREAYSPFYILKEFQEGVYGKLDVELLSVFLQNIAYMYVGNKCKLSDGREGKIIFINPAVLYAPIVEIEGNMVDLQFEKNLKIERVIIN